MNSMTLNLENKTIPQIKVLLLDVERAIKLIEREKRQREAAARRKMIRADEKTSQRKTVDSSPAIVATSPAASERSEDLQRATQPGPKYMHPASRLHHAALAQGIRLASRDSNPVRLPNTRAQRQARRRSKELDAPPRVSSRRSYPWHGTGVLSNMAKMIGIGGVGLYQDRGFIHVDTGPVRAWQSKKRKG